MTPLTRNTLWNLFGSGTPFLLGLVTIPYLIRNVGVEVFGVLTLIWALIGYFSIFDFGIGRALTQQVAKNIASHNVEELSGLIKTGLLFILTVGLAGGGLLAVLSAPLGHKWLNISLLFQQDTVYSLLISAIGIPLTTVTTGLKGVLEAYEDFGVVNVLRFFLGVGNLGFPALCVMTGGSSLFVMVTSLVVVRFLVFVAHLYFVHKKLPSRWYHARFNKRKMGGLLSFGAWMTVSNIVSPLMVVADRFIISSVLGASLVAYYTVPSDFLIRILIIPAALSAALFPRLTSVMSTDLREAERLYRKSIKAIFLTMFPVCFIIAIGSQWGLSLWLGSDFSQHSWKIASVLAIGLFFNGLAHVPYAAVQASGNARITAIIHVGEFVFYLPCLLLFLHLFGLLGAAITWGVRVGVDLLLLNNYAHKIFAKNHIREVV